MAWSLDHTKHPHQVSLKSVEEFFRNTGDKSGVVYHSSCKDCVQFYVGETGRNFKQRLGEHDRAIRLGKVTQSARGSHYRQSGHHRNSTLMGSVPETQHLTHDTFLEAWHVKSREGGLTGETVDIPTQYTPLMQMAKTGWCKQLDKMSIKHLIPNTTSTCAQHPMRTPTLALPTPHHAQHRHETSRVRAIDTQKQQQAHTRAHPHTHTTPDHV